MRETTVNARIAIGLTAVGLLAAACSSSGSPVPTRYSAGSTASSTTNSSSSTTGGSTAGSPTGSSSSVISSSAGDAANGTPLKEIVVQQSDLPGTWKAAPADKDDDDDSQDAALAKCLGVADPDPGNENEVQKIDSPDFTQGAVTISSNATKVKSEDVLDKEAAIFGNPKLAGCFRTFLGQTFAKDPDEKNLKIVKLTVTPGTGGGPSNQVAAFSVQVRGTVNGQTVSLYLDDLAVKGPKLEGDLTFTGIGTPIPAALKNQVVGAMAARIAKG
jgi:hypothetical protein